jgi:hypothetical protein
MFLNFLWQFWMLAVMVGMFQGGVQALSRSYLGKIIPAERSGEFYGLMDICGKGASFVGTTLVAFVNQIAADVEIHLGGIVGAAENATITGCAATGTVVVKKPSHYLNNKTRQVAGLVFKMTNCTLTNSYAALDFADNTAAAYTAALVYTLDSESAVYYNASFCDFSIEPDASKFGGRYNSCSILRSSSAEDNLYFRASDGLSMQEMNSQMVGDAFGGAFKEGTVHPVLVDYEAFLLALEAQQ